MSEPERKGGDTPIGIPRLDALREARRDSRFKLDVEVMIGSLSTGSVSGRTLDLSDHGLSATLPVELPVGQIVQLNFTLRLGLVAVFATVPTGMHLATASNLSNPIQHST